MTVRLIASFTACALAATAAAADGHPLAFELSFGAGADWRYGSDLVGERVAPLFEIDARLVRTDAAKGWGDQFIGLALEERGDIIGSSRGQTSALGLGGVIQLGAEGPHELLLTLGVGVVTAERDHLGAFRSSTGVGGLIAFDYRYWMKTPEPVAFGLRVVDDDAVVGRGGVQRAIGGAALELTLTQRF